MHRARRFLLMTGSSVAVMVVSLPACDITRLTTPCGNSQYSEDGRFLAAKDRIDGLWRLTTIDGSPIPASGYALPKSPLSQAPTKFLRAGILVFTTTSANFSDDCGTLKNSSGTALAQYVLTVSGTNNRKEYPGRFSADHLNPRVATLGAGEYTLPIEITGTPAHTMTARATIEEFGIGFTYVLVFKR